MGKITNETFGVGVVFFREQADVVAERKQPFKESARILMSAQ